MKKLFPWLRENPSLYYLILFLLMILSGIILFFAVQSGRSNLVYVCLIILIMANAAAVFKKI
ncbi:MAG: hypothetical protein K8R16_13180 [Anaerolineales bacterium]|nr:hypothetical protein [Anaerolineales bacterium]